MNGEKITYGDFFERFVKTFDSEMFRLEVRDYYSGSDKEVAAFKSGDLLNAGYGGEMGTWETNLKSKVSEGKRCVRAHIVSEKLSDYLKWEIHWAYKYTAALGEKIRIVPEAVLGELSQNPLISEDFQLLDNQHLVLVQYEPNGRYTGHYLVDDQKAVEHARDVRDQIMTLGTPVLSNFQEYWSDIADAWGLDIEAPFTIELGSGELEIPVLLRGFKPSKGMVLVTDYAILTNNVEELTAKGFGYSCFSDDTDAYRPEKDDEIVQELLNDWGWSGTGKLPTKQGK